MTRHAGRSSVALMEVAVARSNDAPAGSRSFSCAGCGYPITLLPGDRMPECPVCGARRFERASLFIETGEQSAWKQEPRPAPGWLEETRALVTLGEPALALDLSRGPRLAVLGPGLTRIGRSLNADLRLDDPTVSRRHALVSRHGNDVFIVDDHSLNGVYVNGEAIDFRRLDDGDEIVIGGFRLYVLNPPRETEARVP